MRMTKSSEIWNRAERPPSVPSIEPIAPGSYGVQISIRMILQTKILRQHNSTHMICVLYKIWYLRYRKTNMRQRRGHACRRAREAPRTPLLSDNGEVVSVLHFYSQERLETDPRLSQVFLSLGRQMLMAESGKSVRPVLLWYDHPGEPRRYVWHQVWGRRA